MSYKCHKCDKWVDELGDMASGDPCRCGAVASDRTILTDAIFRMIRRGGIDDCHSDEVIKAELQFAALIARVQELERKNAELKSKIALIEYQKSMMTVSALYNRDAIEQARRDGYAIGRDFAARDYVDRVHGNSHPNTTYDEAAKARRAQEETK